MTRYRKEFIDEKIKTYIFFYVKKNDCPCICLDNYLIEYIAFLLGCSKTKVKQIHNDLAKKDFQTWLKNFKY